MAKKHRRKSVRKISSTRRPAKRAAPAKRRKSKSNTGMKGWIPLTTQEHIDVALAGATYGVVDSATDMLGLQNLIGGFAADQAVNASAAIAGAVVHKMAKGSPGIKRWAKETYRKAVSNTAEDLAGASVNGIASGFMGRPAAAGSANSGTGFPV